VSAVALTEATEHQPRARVALSAALRSGPSHAYLFRGPRGAGKRATARAFAAEILAEGAEDAEDARRRAMLDPSPHPDLVWLAPSGAQHLVEAVRERVIRAASYRPFEGERRVFVVEAAEAMRDESQNALLKTLEEPPGFAHLILLSSEPEALLETISSRCQPVEFAALPAAAVEAALIADRPQGQAGPDDSPQRRDEVAAAARISAGDLDRARFLLGDEGKRLRAAAIALTGAVGRGHADARPTAPWRALLAAAETVGSDAEAAAREALEEEKEAGVKRTAREIGEEAKRAGRRRRTEVLDFGLSLCAGWCRDLAAVAAGAEDVVLNRDRLPELGAAAQGLDPAAARRAAELVQDTRRRLDLNVSEELALEALFFRLERELGGGGG
jgi:DNA polymerase-3 subunit delta'